MDQPEQLGGGLSAGPGCAVSGGQIRVAAAVGAIWPSHPRAMLAAVDQARASLLASVAGPTP